MAGVQVDGQHFLRAPDQLGNEVLEDRCQFLGAVSSEVQAVGVSVLPQGDCVTYPRQTSLGHQCVGCGEQVVERGQHRRVGARQRVEFVVGVVVGRLDLVSPPASAE